MTAQKFKPGQTVKHVKTGISYVISVGPDLCKLESTGRPAYAYFNDSSCLWVRDAEEMEDGRFIEVD